MELFIRYAGFAGGSFAVLFFCFYLLGGNADWLAVDCITGHWLIVLGGLAAWASYWALRAPKVPSRSIR